MSYQYQPKLHIDALLFSLNDVLVDVSLSLHQVVRKTVQIYLERALGVAPSPEPLITPEEVIYLQRVGHLPNYWHLARAFIAYFTSLFPSVPVVTFPIKFHVPAILAYLQTASARLHISFDELRDQKQIETLAQQVAQAGGGLDGVYAVLPNKNRHLVVASGDITQINLIGRIFQELYLGADLFEQTYHQPAIVVQSTGYIEHETLLIKPELLAQFQQKLNLGIVSHRPRIEVEHALKTHHILRYFQAMVCMEDIQQARAEEIPAPWLLLEVVRRMYPNPTHAAYVGANPADVAAARAANQVIPFTAIGCLAGASSHRAEVQKQLELSKASVILGHPNHLKELIFD